MTGTSPRRTSVLLFSNASGSMLSFVHLTQSNHLKIKVKCLYQFSLSKFLSYQVNFQNFDISVNLNFWLD